MSRTISIIGWENFQHYKNRDPVWIKLYRDILTTESWVLGTDASRLVQLASLLLAARYKNEIPLQWNLLRRVANLDCSEKSFNESVAHLVQTNFFIINGLDSPLAGGEQDASNLLCQSRVEKKREEKNKDMVASRPCEFDRFWNAYPKKVKRKDAERVWRSKKLDDKAESLIADAIKRTAQDRKWLAGFVPDPTTYLRGERWNDELEVPIALKPWIAPPDDEREAANA